MALGKPTHGIPHLQGSRTFQDFLRTTPLSPIPFVRNTGTLVGSATQRCDAVPNGRGDPSFDGTETCRSAPARRVLDDGMAKTPGGDLRASDRQNRVDATIATGGKVTTLGPPLRRNP